MNEKRKSKYLTSFLNILANLVILLDKLDKINKIFDFRI